MRRQYAEINLPLQEDDSTVYRTLVGEWLVGVADQFGRPHISLQAVYGHQELWGVGRWYVIRSAHGKLVVYRQPILETDAPASVTVYDSFDAMQPNVPPNVYDAAIERASLKEPPQLREIPLEGV